MTITIKSRNCTISQCKHNIVEKWNIYFHQTF
ncbi:hypothetical protein LFX04_08780 [Streptococcus thermophilus]|nr:hypothetical protein [Streptococcus thermophilus]MCA6645090.1 hypothetical protein [Streptococcus thermophilus]